MKLVSSILTSALTSAVVTAVLTALLRHLFDKRILDMERRLDRVYNNLLETDRQRRQTFQRLASRIYETRNAAKELKDQRLIDATALRGLADIVKSLEKEIYEFRLTLEVEGVFISIHAFKNEAKAFLGLIRDLAFCQTNGDMSQEEISGKVRISYSQLDRDYLAIIDRLTARSREIELA